MALAEEQGMHPAAAFLTAQDARFTLTCRMMAEPTGRRPKLEPT
jgi:hypothetical protein